MDTPLCSTCQTPMTYDSAAALFRCKTCGARVERPHETLEQAAARLASQGTRPHVQLTHNGRVDPRAQSIFEAAHDSLWRKQTEDALRLFRRAVEIQPDFADAHLWLAKLAEDPAVQREHLSDILANDPGHLEALRLMMALNGRLPMDAAPADEPTAPHAVSQPVNVEQQTLICPVCGGHLTADDETGRVICKFCGHEERLQPRTVLENAGDTLSMALIERRARPVRWQVGSRVHKCDRCGAARTLPARELSGTCPFCGSTHVLLQDALDTITQPDGLVPFSVTEQDAADAIRERLRGLDERLTGLLDRDNRIVNMTLEGVYLPFWVFDALTRVDITITDDDVRWGDRRSYASSRPAYQHFTVQDGLTGEPVPAFTSPAPELARQVLPFDLDTMLPYEPKLLARYPAVLYDVDFDQASLEARSLASARARERAIRDYQRGEVTVTAMALPLQMTFELALLPVWVGTLFERDGDTRPVLVNGISGRAALGKTKRSPKGDIGR
jgi:DNA-directed RNA polymerase subunit RPC12/RpoP